MKSKLLIISFGLLIVMSLLIPFVNAGSYPTEILPKEQLIKDVISSDKIIKLVEENISSIISYSKTSLHNNPDDVFQKWTFNLYTDLKKAGTPKLIFDDQNAIAYVVPLIKSEDKIGGFMIVDPYDNKIISYPEWNLDGKPIFNIDLVNWENMEKIISNLSGTEFSNESRLILIRDSPYSQILYLATPHIVNKNSLSVLSSSENTSNQVTRLKLQNLIISDYYETLNDRPKISSDINMVQYSNIKDTKSFSTLSRIPIKISNLTDTFLIENYDYLPWKNQKGKSSWESYVNNNLSPVHTWTENYTDDALKCLSYGASTVADWWNIILGSPVSQSYKNFVRGETEYGLNPRELETLYHNIYPDNWADCGCIICYADILGIGLYDPITKERIPYCISGYAKILTNTPNFDNLDDPEIPGNADFQYNTWDNKYRIDNYYLLNKDSNYATIDEYLRQYGIIYVQMKDTIISVFPVHTVAMVGYGKLNGNDILIIHDSYGNSSYKAITNSEIATSLIYFKSKSKIPIQGFGSSTHSCSTFDSITGIDSITWSDSNIKPGDTINVIIDWHGWHFSDENHWAFFLDSSLSPIGTCKSNGFNNGYDSNTPYDINYQMNCSFIIPQNTTKGEHILKITSNDVEGYCYPHEPGVDAQISKSIIIEDLCTPNLVNTSWSNWQNISCLPNNLRNQSKFLTQYDINNCGTIENKTIYEYRTILPCGNLIIDLKKPRISKTLPRRNSFTNGSDFYIRYSEENLKKVSIIFNPTIIINQCNLSGKNIQCPFSLNLASYNGQQINYKMQVEDIAGNIDESREIPINVDTTSPIINYINKSIDNKRVKFTINISELNLDVVEYMDNSDSRPKWKPLCNRLKNGICERRITFKPGNHNLTIRAIDKAGNSDSEGVEFSIL
ncbi:hypothetical protein J4466_02670 [Candidatus Pacearchaeota archaeon]|nr:hypothetical protein [Candidatus Pacearchaeota archaeon]